MIIGGNNRDVLYRILESIPTEYASEHEFIDTMTAVNSLLYCKRMELMVGPDGETFDGAYYLRLFNKLRIKDSGRKISIVCRTNGPLIDIRIYVTKEMIEVEDSPMGYLQYLYLTENFGAPTLQGADALNKRRLITSIEEIRDVAKRWGRDNFHTPLYNYKLHDPFGRTYISPEEEEEERRRKDKILEGLRSITEEELRRKVEMDDESCRISWYEAGFYRGIQKMEYRISRRDLTIEKDFLKG